MSELTDLLARIRSDAGDSSSGVYNTFEMDKALDLARKQQAALDAVKALHVAVDVEVFDNPTTNSSHIEWMCGECDTYNYPCPTMEALEAIR
jgi:hypothetical protein